MMGEKETVNDEEFFFPRSRDHTITTDYVEEVRNQLYRMGSGHCSQS